LVRFENVGMRYGKGPDVLRDVSFELGEGTLWFLTGASGAGKSTLLKLMYLAERPTAGSVELFGRDVAGVRRRRRPELRRRIGVVFQDFRLLRHLSTFENVALPLRVAGVRDERVRADVGELLDWVGLGDRLDAFPDALSGGQQQRIAIARAVIARPKLIVADEPTGNVDDRMALRLMHLFEELHRLGATVVIATHNEALVSRFGHPRLHLEAGALVPLRRPLAATG
jgi:cell division transport system ATP-binding protein